MTATIYALYDVFGEKGSMIYTADFKTKAKYSAYQAITVTIPECLHAQTDEHGHICWGREYFYKYVQGNTDGYDSYPTLMYSLSPYSDDDGSPVLMVNDQYIDFSDSSAAAYDKDRGSIPLNIIAKGPIIPYTQAVDTVQELDCDTFFTFDN